MLPILKKKQVAGLIISHRKPDGSTMEQHSEGDEDHALKAASEDLLRAITSKDVDAFASAIRAAFEILESQPHEEYSENKDEGEEQ